MNSVNFQSRLRRNFSGPVNFQAVFSSDSVNVAGPLSKTATKSMSQPILFHKNLAQLKFLVAYYFVGGTENGHLDLFQCLNLLMFHY